MEKLETIYDKFLKSKGVCTDTRKDLEGKIFFALKGPRFNGNQYALHALQKGASYAVVDEIMTESDDRMIYVDDVLLTLQNLGRMHRRSLATPILGITGSNGKTTNKELIHAILNQKFNCYATKGNLNNHIGVPLSLLELNEDHDFAVIEMGANKPNDIEELCQICEPNHGYITNIGLAHLEGFGSPEAIAFGKGALYRYVKNRKGVFFVNKSSRKVAEMSKDYKIKVTVGEDDAADYVFDCLQILPKIVVEHKKRHYSSSLYGNHNYENVKMAIAIGLEFGVDQDSIENALKQYVSKNNRSQIMQWNGVNVYLDAYNANPSSTRASIESFRMVAFDQKVLVLGDMLELGEYAQSYHKEILDLVSETDWKHVILVGNHYYELKDLYPKFRFILNAEEIKFDFPGLVAKGDAVLLKGSRGVALEKLLTIQQQQ